MKLRTIALIAAGVMLLAVAVGVTFKLTQTTESQKAKEIDNKTFEPHMLFGCASYKVMMYRQETQEPKVKHKKARAVPEAKQQVSNSTSEGK